MARHRAPRATRLALQALADLARQAAVLRTRPGLPRHRRESALADLRRTRDLIIAQYAALRRL